MSPEMISAIAAGIVAVGGAFFGFTKWVLDKFLKELRPNGGNSIKDQVTRLDIKVAELSKHQEKVDSKIDQLYILILDHFDRKS